MIEEGIDTTNKNDRLTFLSLILRMDQHLRQVRLGKSEYALVLLLAKEV